MTDQEISERLQAKINVYRMEREVLLRIIKDLWDLICEKEQAEADLS